MCTRPEARRTWIRSAAEPSAPSTTGPMRPGPSVGPTTTAPAPSPNSAAVRRSSGSTKRDIRSAPITSTWPCPAGLHLPRGQRQRGEEAAARGAHVERSGPGGAEGTRHQRGGVGQQVVLAHGGHHHEVEVGGVEAGARERVATGRRREVREARLRRRHAPLPDAGAAEDPVLGHTESLGDRRRWPPPSPAGWPPPTRCRRPRAARASRREQAGWRVSVVPVTGARFPRGGPGTT